MAEIEQYHFNQSSRMAYIGGQSQGATRLAMENFYGGFMASTGGPMGLLCRKQKFFAGQGAVTFETGSGQSQYSNIITGIGFVISSYSNAFGSIFRPVDVLTPSSNPQYRLKITEAATGNGVRVFPDVGNDIHIPVVTGRYIHVPVYYTGLANSNDNFYQPQAGSGFPEPSDKRDREGLPGAFPMSDEYHFAFDGSNCNSIITSTRLSAQRHPVNPAVSQDGDDGGELDTDGVGDNGQRFKQRSPSNNDELRLNIQMQTWNGSDTSSLTVNFSTFDIYGMVFRFNR